MTQKIFRLLSLVWVIACTALLPAFAQHYVGTDGLKYTIFKENGKEGVRISHQTVVPAAYNSICYIDGTYDLGIFVCRKEEKCELYSTDGRLIYTPKNGTYVYSVTPVYAGDKCFYSLHIGDKPTYHPDTDICINELIDPNGNCIISESEEANNIHLISCNGKYVFFANNALNDQILYVYDIDGNFILEYANMSGLGLFYNNGFFITLYNGEYCRGIYNLKGEQIVSPEDGYILWENGLFSLPEADSMSIINNLDYEDYPQEIDAPATLFINKKDGLCGVCYSDETVVIPYQFNGITYNEMANGQSYFTCMEGNTVSVYDISGKNIIPLSAGYTEVLPIGNPYKRMFVATKGEYYAVIDEEGNTILPYSLELTDVKHINKGFIVKKGNTAALYTETGAAVIPFSRNYSYIGFPSSYKYIFVRDQNNNEGVCDFKGVERISPIYTNLYCMEDEKNFKVFMKDGSSKLIPTWFAPVERVNYDNYAQTQPQQQTRTQAQTAPPAAQQRSNTKRYYRYSVTDGGVTMPADNLQIDITFNDNGSFTAFNRVWTYNGTGAFGEKRWYSGHDYATMYDDKSTVIFTKCEQIGGLFWGAVRSETYTGKSHSQEDMQMFSGMMNGASGGSGSHGSGTGTNNGNRTKPGNGNNYCRRCNGTGEVIKNTYPPQYSGTTDYDKKCYKCNQWFKASLGHSHVTCGSCGGTGRLR